MNRKEFLAHAGLGASLPLLPSPSCLVSLWSCTPNKIIPTPIDVDFTVDISTSPMTTKGGYIDHNGVIVAHTLSNTYIAVSAACTHEGFTLNYRSGTNDFHCTNPGATFCSTGQATGGPTNRSLSKYKLTIDRHVL